MSNSGLNLLSLSTPKPTVQSEDLLHAVNHTLDEFINTKYSNIYNTFYSTQNQHSHSSENDPKMQSENIILSEINSGLWDKAIISAISLLTQNTYPHYIIAQKFFNYIFNVKPNYNFSLVKEFFMKLLLSHPPTTNMFNYYWEIISGKYITVNGKTPEDETLILSVINMLTNLLKTPEKFQPECESNLTQEQEIVEVTKNLNDIVLNNSLFISQNKTMTSYNELSWSEKIKRCTIVLKIIYEILETNYNLCSQNDFSDLLVLKILWPDIKNIGFVNKEVNKVLTLYRLSFQLGESNFHLIKTISKLINLIGETVRESDKNEGIKYPYFGTKTSNFVRELSYRLSEYFEKFGETSELILGLMPSWLRLLFCTNLLNFLTEYQCSPELVGVCDILEHITSCGSGSKDQPKPSESESSISMRIVKKLKKLKSINGRNANGETPLQLACSRNNSEEVKALLTFPELDLNGTDGDGWTALHLAAFKGHVACVEELLKFHPKSLQKPVNTRARGPNNTTPLMCGVTQGHLEVCRLLLDHSGSVLLEDVNESNETPLQLSNNPEISKLLKYYKDNNIKGHQKNNTINIRQEYKESVSRICVEMIQAYFTTHRTWDVYKKLKKLKENNSEENLSSVEVISTVDYIRYHRDIKTNICKLRRLVPKLEEVKEFSSCFQFYTEILNSNK